MKKNYFILSLLALAATSALAQVEEVSGVGKGNKLTDLAKLDDTEAFTLVVPAADRGALIAVGDNAYATGTQGVAPNADAANQQFAIVSKDANYYLFSISEQKFVNKGADANAVLSIVGQPVEFIYAEGNYWQIYLSEKRLNFGGGGGMAINDYGNIKYAAKGNNEEDDGNKFTITSVGTSDAITAAIAKAKELLNTRQVTFKLKVGEDEVNEQANVTQVIGQAPEVPAGFVKDFAQYTVYPETIEEGTTEVTVTFTNYEFPFELSADYENAKWYFVSLKGMQAAWNETTNINHDQGVIRDNKKDAAQYAFIGNATDYNTTIKVINKAAGAGKTLQVAETNENSNAAEFHEEGTEGKQQVWYVLDRKDGNFMLQTQKGGEYINNYSDDWKLWNGANDDGSFFKVQAVPEGALVNVTYNIYFGTEKVATAVIEQYEDEDPELPKSLDRGDIVKYQWDQKGKVAENNKEYNITVTLTESFAVDFSEDFDNANWVNLSLRGNKYLNFAAEEPYKLVENPTDEQLASDEFQWAFLGSNPYDVVIINKAAGAGYSLKLDENGNYVLSEGEFKHSVVNIENGIAIIDYQADGSLDILDDNQGKMKSWHNGNINDAGNAIASHVVPVISTPTPVSSIEAAEAEVEGIFTIDGRKVEKLQRGVNIIRQRNAEGGIDVKKVIVK